MKPTGLALIALTSLLAPRATAQEPAWPVSTGAPAPSSEDRFGPVPRFEFEAAGGGTVSRESLKGEVWIGVPFFLRCTGPCPSITRDLLERVYPELEGTGIRLVSFSIDPEFDTPAELASYMEDIGVDAARWSFLSTDEEEAMHEFVRDGLKVPLARNEGEDDPGLAITHGTRMPVVDAEGRIAGWYEIADPVLPRMDGRPGLPPAEAAALLDARFALMLNRARALAGLDFDGPPAQEGGAASRSRIPLLNAMLNGLAFVLLTAGIVAIKRGHKEVHRLLMRAAFIASAAFLAFYLYYHFAVLPISGGPTRFNGDGAAKVLYLVMLLTHVVLAVVNLPMVLRTFWLAHKEDWTRHKRLARWTFPIWMYVSVTGVLVYVVLYHLNPPAA